MFVCLCMCVCVCIYSLPELLEYKLIHKVNCLSLLVYLDYESITYHVPCTVIRH